MRVYKWQGQRTCLVQLRGAGLGAHVHHIDAGRDEAGQHQLGAGLGTVPIAAAACVPSRVVQLVLQVGHGQSVDDLRWERGRG